MITSDIAQLFGLPSTNGGLFGLQGQNMAGGLGMGPGKGEGLDGGGMFAGLVQNLFAEGGLEGLGMKISDAAQGEGLGPLSAEGLAALKNSEGEVEQGAIVQITQIITVVYQEFTLLSGAGVNFEGLDNAQELAAAYQQLGMPPEEASSRAARLTIMMLVMDNRISMSDLLSGITDPQQLGLQEKHQSAFIHIEQTIQKFSVASTGGGLSLADAIRDGGPLPYGMNGGMNDGMNGADNGQKASAILASLSDKITLNGKAAENGLAQNTRNGEAGNGLATARSENGFLSGAMGRMESILNALATEAAKQPDGADLAKQLEQMAGAVKRISDQAVNDGGLKQLEANLPLNQSQSKAQDASIQNLAGQKAQREITAQADADQAQKVQENIKAQVAERQSLPEGEGNRLERSAGLPPRSQGSENAASRANAGLISREPALAEPQTPTYVVRASAGGGVEVVNPDTGEVIQPGNPGQNPASQNFSSNTGEAGMAQSRGLENAMQARLARQVSVHVRNLAGHGGGQIVVGLNPPELGRVQVRLEIMEGHVKGAITVQRPDVAETIARDMRALETAFQDMGLNLGEEGISIQLEQNPADQENENNNNEQNGSGTRLASNEAGEQIEDDQNEQQWVNPDRLLDVQA